MGRWRGNREVICGRMFALLLKHVKSLLSMFVSMNHDIEAKYQYTSDSHDKVPNMARD